MSRPETEIDIRLDIPPASGEDKELALAFKRGDKGAYQAIYDRHAARVHRVCRRMLMSPDDAQEAAQETFLKIYQALNRFNGRYQMGAWITRIATNVCLDHLRASSRRPTVWAPVDELDEKALPRVGKLDEEPELFVIKKSESARVQGVLRSLPPLHRAAIVLRDFEGLAYWEIAVALEISEAQVKALLHRARQGFKRSWTTRVMLSLPTWGLLGRIRKSDASFVEPTASVATSANQIAQVSASVSNFAASCAGVLQQCGQVVSEKFASALTVAIVGTAAITGAASSDASPKQREPVVAEREKTVATALLPRPQKERKPQRAENEVVVPAPVPSPVPEQVEPEPQPAPTTNPEEQEEAPPSEPRSKPTYGPVAPSVGWERGGAIPQSTPTSNEMTFDCTQRSFSQTLETSIHDGSASYPALLSIHASGSGSWNLDLTVWKNEQETTYNGGSSSLTVSGSGRDTVWATGGSYGSYGPNQPSYVGLPSSGRFSLKLGLDCIASAVVTESISFTTG